MQDSEAISSFVKSDELIKILQKAIENIEIKQQEKVDKYLEQERIEYNRKEMIKRKWFGLFRKERNLVNTNGQMEKILREEAKSDSTECFRRLWIDMYITSNYAGHYKAMAEDVLISFEKNPSALKVSIPASDWSSIRGWAGV